MKFSNFAPIGLALSAAAVTLSTQSAQALSCTGFSGDCSPNSWVLINNRPNGLTAGDKFANGFVEFDTNNDSSSYEQTLAQPPGTVGNYTLPGPVTRQARSSSITGLPAADGIKITGAYSVPFSVIYTTDYVLQNTGALAISFNFAWAFAGGTPGGSSQSISVLSGINPYSLDYVAPVSNSSTLVSGLYSSPFIVNPGQYFGFRINSTGLATTVNDAPYLQITSFGVTEVPGPLPVLGAAAAFGWSRRLRQRIKAAAQPS
jgi:hypothetical protein